MSKNTKSKNMDMYCYFLPYVDSSLIPIATIAKKFGVHKNHVNGVIGSAKRNPSIYIELIAMGYADSQIPPWFARPGRETKKGEAALVEPLRPQAPKFDKSSQFIAAQAPAPSPQVTVIRPTTINSTPVFHVPSLLEIKMQNIAEEMEQDMIKDWEEEQLFRRRKQEAFKRRLKESEKTPGQRLAETWASPQFIEATKNLSTSSYNSLIQNMLNATYPEYREVQGYWNTLLWMNLFSN